MSGLALCRRALALTAVALLASGCDRARQPVAPRIATTVAANADVVPQDIFADLNDIRTKIKATGLTGAAKEAYLKRVDAVERSVRGGRTKAACEQLATLRSSILGDTSLTQAEKDAIIKAIDAARTTLGC